MEGDVAVKKQAPKTAAEYKALVNSIVESELKQRDEYEIRALVRSRLHDGAFDIVMAALGLSRKWGDWEVDHCNGLRNAAADAMLKEARGAAEEWLREQAGNLPQLPKSAIKALHRDYLENLESEVSRRLRERASGEAMRIVNDMLSGVASE
jgi:hypothetical protein